MLRAIGNTEDLQLQLPSRQSSCPRGNVVARGKAPATCNARISRNLAMAIWPSTIPPPAAYREGSQFAASRQRPSTTKGTCHRVSKTRPSCMKMAANLEHEGESEKHSRHKPQPQMRCPPYRSCERKSVGARREDLTLHRSSTASSPW